MAPPPSVCLRRGSNSKSLRSRNAAAVCPSPPGSSKAPPGRPPLQAQSRLLTPGTFLPNAWVVAFLAYFTPPLPTDHIAQFRSSPSLPFNRRAHQSAEKHRNCQMQFLSGDDKFATICISKQELQFLSGFQAGSPPPPKPPPTHGGQSTPYLCCRGKGTEGWEIVRAREMGEKNSQPPLWINLRAPSPQGATKTSCAWSKQGHENP